MSAHASILKVYENVPYRKIIVLSKFGACFTISRLVINCFCYIFCFMGIMQCCVACSKSHILQRTKKSVRLLTNIMTGRPLLFNSSALYPCADGQSKNRHDALVSFLLKNCCLVCFAVLE